MRISGTEPSSVILSQTMKFKKTTYCKSNSQKKNQILNVLVLELQRSENEDTKLRYIQVNKNVRLEVLTIIIAFSFHVYQSIVLRLNVLDLPNNSRPVMHIMMVDLRDICIMEVHR